MLIWFTYVPETEKPWNVKSTSLSCNSLSSLQQTYCKGEPKECLQLILSKCAFLRFKKKKNPLVTIYSHSES